MDGAVSGENLADEVATLETELDRAFMDAIDLEEQLENAKHDVRAAGFLGFLLGFLTALLLFVGLT